MNNLKRKSYYKKKYKKFDIVKVYPVDFIKKIPNKQVMRQFLSESGFYVPLLPNLTD